MTEEKAETWWRWHAWSTDIRPVLVEASTNHTVTVVREIPEGGIIKHCCDRRTGAWGFFRTYAKAKRYAIQCREREVASCEAMLESARQSLAQAMALPDEPPSP